MICFQCSKEVKDTARICKYCGLDLRLPPIWRPTWRWHVRALVIIYVSLILVYVIGIFLLKKIPPPYNQRVIPKEMTPWLK